MPRIRTHPLHDFYRPFFESRSGQIFILCAPKDHVRDGLAAIQVARQFPLPEYEEIRIEPTRPYVTPKANVILVGRAPLFVGPDKEGVRGKPPIAMGYNKLGKRLEAIAKACCYTFEGGGNRVIRNVLTGAVFASTECDELGKEVDHAVIRRVLKDASENTLSLEGNHGLGTLGAASVATSTAFIEEIRNAIAKIGDYDPSNPLEILVRTTFDPSVMVYTMSDIEVSILNIVYKKQWIYDMADQVWVDQQPYDISLELRGGDPVVISPSGARPVQGPSLEVEADLRQLKPETRDLCLQLLGRSGERARSPKPADRAARLRLLARLTTVSDLFRLTLRDENEWGGRRVRPLLAKSGEIRLERKRFLVHLVLCLLLGERFHLRDQEIHKHFPEFGRRKRRKGQTLTGSFAATISGRMRDGFLLLFGEVRKPTHYAQILHVKKEKTYWLHLQRLAVVVKLRV